MEIIFCHLLNDASGSPRVLLNIINSIKSEGTILRLYIGSSGNGLLDGCEIPIRRYWYFRSRYRIFTLFSYLLSQVILFFYLLSDRSISKNSVIYINTLLPFGAAIFGKLTGRKVIYHLHESHLEPKLLLFLLCSIVKFSSSRNIYVSKSHSLALPIKGVKSSIIYNSLSRNFYEFALNSKYKPRNDNFFTILMITSFREYKGVSEFISLSHELKSKFGIKFILVLNDSPKDINNLKNKHDSSNLIIYPRTDKPEYFYKQASLVLNLTRVDRCEETFGLTVLEAMTFGIPVIVPPIGGPAELVSDGIEGFHVDSRDAALLRKRVISFTQSSELCNKISSSARIRSQQFSDENFKCSIHKLLQEIIGVNKNPDYIKKI
jgi:glycosyltransferase involved in cell wall biosynthesis